MKIISILTFNIFFVFCSTVAGQDLDKSELKEKMKQRMSKIPVFNEKETSIKNPFDLRDPFKRKMFRSGEKSKNQG